MKNIEFKKIDNENKFEFILNTAVISFNIISAPNNSFIGEIDNIYIYELDNDAKCTIEKTNSEIIMTFYLDTNQQEFNFEILGSRETQYNNNLLTLKSSENEILEVFAKNCFFNEYKNNNLKLTVLSNEATLTFKVPQQKFKSMATTTEGDGEGGDTGGGDNGGTDTTEVIVPGDSFKSFVDDNTTLEVPIFTRGPEFSLGVFDLDGEPSGGKRNRPVRLGVPVISMVPAYAENLGEIDGYYYERGVGPQSRNIYFRVVCNQELPNQTVKLLVYMPNGLDTISYPDSIPLTKVSTAGNPSVYHGKYTFFEEDNVYSVDGFVYFSVFVEMIQSANLPIQATDEAYVKPDNRQIERDLY